jgi:hypothetical protein
MIGGALEAVDRLGDVEECICARKRFSRMVSASIGSYNREKIRQRAAGM